MASKVEGGCPISVKAPIERAKPKIKSDKDSIRAFGLDFSTIKVWLICGYINKLAKKNAETLDDCRHTDYSISVFTGLFRSHCTSGNQNQLS